MEKTLHSSKPELDADNNLLSKESFDNYQLSVSYKFIRTAILIIALFNLLLFIPDFINLSGTKQLASATIIRAFFTLVILILFILIKK